MTAKATDFEGYLSSAPESARQMLSELRRIVKETAPGAVEGISYGMPTFKYKGRPLVYFGGWKDHCALYGADLAAHPEATAYQTSKGTLSFPLDRPLPEMLVRTLVADRIAQLDAEVNSKS